MYQQPGAENASDDEDDGPEVALFAVHSDNDNSSVSDDDDIVAILDEEEVFGQVQHGTRIPVVLAMYPNLSFGCGLFALDGEISPHLA